MRSAVAATVNCGASIKTVISSLIVALVTFLLIRALNRLRREEEKVPAETTKECLYCLSMIPVQATRCAYCPSELG
ncbi:MAG: hypothetical protein CEE40_08770 [Chloroflexi bacterium B3_Chlor]|nr:MAG: hypothetical protein CEE40_08770 [Chloroflexi bacterium B3_Chlor]